MASCWALGALCCVDRRRDGLELAKRPAGSTEALERLPLSARDLEQGTLHWCAARELTCVATTETERAWLEAARGKTTREVEHLVAGKRPGDLPPRANEPPPRRHVLRFEVAPETLATFRDARLSLRRAAGAVLDDDALLLTMARQVLGAPLDVGRSSYLEGFESPMETPVAFPDRIAARDYVLEQLARWLGDMGLDENLDVSVPG